MGACRFCLHKIERRIAENRVACWMSRSGNCWGNGAVQGYFSLLKTERVGGKVYRSRDEAKADVFDYIERFNNPTRRHATIGYKSPIDFKPEAGVT